MAAAAGMSMGLVLVIVVACVFVTVLSVVVMVKVLQIAEDLRYIRSKSDISVQRPKPHKNTLIVCLVASLVICFVVVGFLMTFAAGLGVNRVV